MRIAENGDAVQRRCHADQHRHRRIQHRRSLGSFIGALMIATLNNGMDLLGVPSFYQMVMKGVIIIVTVSIDKNQRE